MARDLDAAVEEMVKEGWDEDVARNVRIREEGGAAFLKSLAEDFRDCARPAPGWCAP